MLKWKDCFVKTYEDIGGPVCTADKIEYMEQYLYRAMLDPLNIFCSDYDDSDRCDKFKNLPSTSIDQIKYETVFPGVVNLFENL